MKKSNSKIGALIPIRLASERLPNKAIKELCGKPVVCHLLDRAFDSRYLDKSKVVVCTTTDKTDDPLVDIVKNYGASVFRGSVNDIIERFYKAMLEYDLDYVIQIDGDDITAEPLYMDLTMDKLLSDSTIDVVTCKDLPLGIATKSFSLKAMKKVISIYKSTSNDTGFSYYFTKTGYCKHEIIYPVSDNHKNDKLRLTLDYNQDMELFKVLFNALYSEGKVFHLDEIISFVKKNPNVVNINLSLEEEYWQRTISKVNLEFTDENGIVRKIKEN